MFTTSNIRNKYENIQKQLFYMIPEKWDRVYLYASVIQHYNSIQTGEMFFYYYPKGVLKKNPINVYEVPNKFNIDEKAYLKLAENLYKEIKELRNELVSAGEKPWSSLTITIENFKFNAIFGYEDLINSKITNNDRHLIWRCKYLEVSPTIYSGKTRKTVEEYLKNEKKMNFKLSTYQEGIYKKPVGNIIEYNKEEKEVLKVQSPEPTQEAVKQEMKQEVAKQIKKDVTSEIKSQILKFN